MFEKLRYHLGRPAGTEASQLAQASVEASTLIKSPFDERDYVFTPKVAPPDRFDQGGFFPKVEDQGTIGCCTGETMTTMCESIIVEADRRYDPSKDLSARYNYYWSRKYDGVQGDGGATLRSMCRSARNYGLPTESAWPLTANIDEPPTQEVIDAALTQRLSTYEVITPGETAAETRFKIEAGLAEGLRVCVAFNVSKWMLYVSGSLASSFQKAPALLTADLSTIIGAHVVPIRGYDRALYDGEGAFIIQNSWGSSWGHHGLWAMPYSLFDDPKFLVELRAIRGFKGIELPYMPDALPPPAVPKSNSSALFIIAAALTIAFALLHIYIFS